jgi:hypothetical protein
MYHLDAAEFKKCNLIKIKLTQYKKIYINIRNLKKFN